jgi:hypothetical protein
LYVQESAGEAAVDDEVVPVGQATHTASLDRIFLVCAYLPLAQCVQVAESCMAEPVAYFPVGQDVQPSRDDTEAAAE